MDPTDRLREICLALPEAHEKLFGGHTTPTWRVRDKIFAMLAEDEGDGAVWLKAPLGAQAILIANDPDRFFSPPYVGPKGWIGIHLDATVDWEAVDDLIRDSYLMTAPKRIGALLIRESE